VEHSDAEVPRGHGEVLTRPHYEEWAALMGANADAAAGWAFAVAGTPAGELRARARREALHASRTFSARLGVPVMTAEAPELLAMTGHQPEFYHPGVWAKDFLLQRLADETGAAAVDLVVDSDAFEAVEVVSPCLKPGVSRCRSYLALGAADTCYACVPAPSTREIDDFCAGALDSLETLRAPAIARHLGRFCDHLRSALPEAHDIAELVTIARRRYEAVAGTTYLELPVTSEARGEAFAAFFADIALRAAEFAEVHDSELAAFRKRNRLRSKARPFPDLRRDGELVELPFWQVGRKRRSLWARTGSRPAVSVDGEVLLELPRDPAEASEAVASADLGIAPRAVTLTTFNRLFVSDLFIHGTGGARYDLVTDAVIRRFYGIEPPRFVVASMTMYLPLGAHAVTPAEVAAAEEKLNRLAHNPDQLLDECTFDDAAARMEAFALAEEKSVLTADIRREGADKKTIGARIREVNERLATLLAPLAAELGREVESLRAQLEAADIVTDRTYPFCFWSPEEVADKVR
jgi:hypothetical protein